MLSTGAMLVLCPITNFRSLLTASWTPSCGWPTYRIPSSVPEAARPLTSNSSDCNRHRPRWNNGDLAVRHRRRDVERPAITTCAGHCPATPTRTCVPPSAVLPCHRECSDSAWNGPLKPSTVWNAPPATSTYACWPRTRRSR